MHVSGSSIVRLLLLLSSLAVLPAAAVSVDSVEAPFAPKAAAEALRLAPGGKAALRLELGEADVQEIAAVKKANTEQFHKRLQIGVGRHVPAVAQARGNALRWEPVAGGGYAAQWEIASAGARALRVELEAGRLPDGVQLRFAGAADTGTVYGPFTADDIQAIGATYWSPVLEGERAIVEVYAPDMATREVSLRITRVSHLFVSPMDPNADVLAKAAQFCEVDLICRSATDAALERVGRAVARMTFSDGLGGGTSLCTGTLLNTTAGAVAPYFYSANHCIDNQASASTLTTHWFYDRTGCGTGGTSSSYVQVPGGATLLYNNATTDVLLVRLNQNPPSNAIYAGWDSETLGTGTALTAVHHPDGDLKKVSLGTSGGFSAYGGGAGDTHLIALWNGTSTGVTEGGSSGSGIFSFTGSSYLLRGGLHGGPSSCTATGVNLRDYYSRFDRAFNFVSQYLNPGTTPTCTYSLSPTSASFGSGGSSGTFSVTTSSGCTWSAASNANWLTTGSSGNGNGTVTYSVSANTSSARTGTITVGGQSFTVTQQAGSGGTGTEVVSNGGFESGASGWTQQASGGAAIIVANASQARTGSGVAWLGGYVSGTDRIYQDIAIPAGASPVTLRYWYRVTTAETTPGAWDFLELQVLNPSSGAVLSTVASYSNQNAGGWTQSPAFDLSAYAGQTIRLRFTATNDFSDTTSFYIDDISLTATTSGTGTTSNYTGLWYNFPANSEAGWGINFTHQGDIVFATLFTYDLTGAPMWLVMAAGNLTSGTTYSGTLYRTRGPAFNANPFVWDPNAPGNLTVVGTMTVTFTAADRASLSYTYNGVAVTKTITRQVLVSRASSCTSVTGFRSSLTNYQDLWYKSPAETEPGWGVNIAQEDNVLFATLFTYESTGGDLWLVMARGDRQPDGSYFGTLYRTRGPAFNANPFVWDPNASGNLTAVGTMRFSFSNGENGTLTYTYNGATVTKPITRQLLRHPSQDRVPSCN